MASATEEWRWAWHKPTKLSWIHAQQDVLWKWYKTTKLNWIHVQQDRLLPLRPIWPGFAINTVFYASILWLFTLGPFTARRMIRRKRGLCTKCGYDLRNVEHEKCPECGAAVSHHH